jgi:hypothetical protein
MSHSVQKFIVALTEKGAQDLWAAYEALPEDRRNWSPGGEARTAGDMVAEVAILNGETAKTLKTASFSSDFDFGAYSARKAALAADPAALKELFDSSVVTITSAIADLPDDQFETVVQFPWGPMKLAQILTYPYWNMGYHEGQINYIGAILATG